MLRSSHIRTFLFAASTAAICHSAIASNASPAESCKTARGDEAIKACTTALQGDELMSAIRAPFLVARGTAYSREGKYELAIADFNEAIRVKPDFIPAIFNRGITYNHEALYDLAIADFNLVIKFNPNDADGFGGRGTANDHKGQYDLAIADYTEAIRLKPSLAAAFTDRGTTYYHKGQYDLAVADYTAAIRLKPGDVQLLIDRGITYNRAGQYDLAIADYTAALRLEPDDADALDDRGIAHDHKGENELAIADFTEVIRLKPDDLHAYTRRCRSKAVDGKDLAGALADCSSASHFDPKDAVARQYLGFVKLRMGQNRDAIADYSAALAIAPASPYTLFGRGVAKLRSGDFAGGNSDIVAAEQRDPHIEKVYAGDGVTIDVSDPEMKAIFDADQSARMSKAIDWKVIVPADDKRRERTRELLAQGSLHTAEDYWEAAFIFQHGDTSDSYLLAHVLATVAVAKGDTKAIWIAAATLDRYLMKVGQKQILGTQYSRPDPNKSWTQDPYDRDLVSDALRGELQVETQAEQAEKLKKLQDEK